jgi:trk system potassium uptake protein TrkH
MSLPFVVSITYNDGSAYAFLLAMLTTCALGIAGFLLTRKQKEYYLSHRDGVAIVASGWVVAGLVATLPYLFSGAVASFTDVYFECISGFTTTGSSILTDIESLPPGLLLWRSQTQWLGGMGIIVLSVAVLPFLGIGGMQLYRAETPSPVADKLTPRITDTAKALWKIYIALTVLQIVFLFAGGMTIFDAVCHAFSTMPTGGFSPKNASIAHYGSGYIEFVVIIFMFAAGINFSLHYKLVTGNIRQFIRDPEFRVYIGLIGAFILILTLDLFGSVYHHLTEAFRYASFQVISIMTTTGFVTADFEKWPPLSQQILLFSMFLGGMAGSTGGGIKLMRIVLLAKHCYLEIFRIIHPHAITVIKLGSIPVSQSIMRSIWGFFLLYIGIFIGASIILTFLGLDLVTSFSAAATCLGNVGPGFGSIGPMDNFAHIPASGKWIMIFCMLLGRLEIYTIIVLLIPGFWRK